MIVIARKEEMGSNSYIRNSEAIVSLSLMVENLVTLLGRRAPRSEILRLHWRKSRVYPFMVEQAFMGRMRQHA